MDKSSDRSSSPALSVGDNCEKNQVPAESSWAVAIIRLPDVNIPEL